jgi:hypothetical protein
MFALGLGFMALGIDLTASVAWDKVQQMKTNDAFDIS